MRVAQVARFGGPEVLVTAEAADPVAGPGQVLIGVAVADLLFVEAQLRTGWGQEYFGQKPPYVPVLMGVRAGRRSETTACVYTTGLSRFGRMDLERLDVEAPPGQLYGQMCDLVAFALSSGTVFHPGQTLELGESRTLVTNTEQSPFTGQHVLRLTAG